MEIKITLKENSYSIFTGRNILKDIASFYNFSSHKVLIVTDSNIPSEYYSLIKEKINVVDTLILSPGEDSKSFNSYLKIQEKLLEHNFSRKDIVIALGGGVIGDLVGFASSTYKRGLKFINIPSSTLSMIDSSIGGKTAINFNGIKNVIGTFYQPSLVLIDFDLLKSLPQRHFNNGLIEALKAGYIYDPSILDLFSEDINSNLEEIIIKSIIVKKHFVEEDEKEQNIRKILNYGHTFGHGFESLGGFNDSLYHGEAVGLGMLVVSIDKEKLISYLNKLDIKYDFEISSQELIKIILNDKKVDGKYIDLILVDNIGESYIKKTSLEDLVSILEGGLEYVRRFRK